MKSGIEVCDECGAERPPWLGGYHTCPDPDVEHPYDYFGNPLNLED
jgi:hypothetical protein